MRALWRFAMVGILLMLVPLVSADPLGELKDFFSTLPKSDLADEDEDEETAVTENFDLQIDLRTWRRGGQTFAQLPALQRYLNRVAMRVLANKADARRPVQVIIAPSAAFGAYTLPNGGIFVNLGTILALRSEDEVAALLGHEIAHLLLRHHDSDEYRNLLDKGFKVAELYMASRGQQFGKRDFQKLQAASWVSQKALFPAWSRKQEDAADRKGVDLLVAAGYNADAMVRLLKIVARATERQQKELQALPPKQAVERMIREMERKVPAEHASAVARQKGIRAYLKERHADRQRPAFLRQPWQAALQEPRTASAIARYRRGHRVERLLTTGSNAATARDLRALLVETDVRDAYLQMLAFRIALMQKDGARAMTALRQAHASGTAPFLTYRILAELAVRKQDYVQADRYLKELNTLFDYPPQTLPLTISVNRRLKRFLLPLQMRCVATADKALIQRCNEAATR